MPQGLSNAPATFQRAMDAVMEDLKLSCVLVYLDDINVFSCTFTAMAHTRVRLDPHRGGRPGLKGHVHNRRNM
ncbi:hypothetical protein DSO57_1011195 [Entomophthora muscae]|uniref:Uncharacterized protein n=1 Tax=Entomophthora muscae TaxID=34485 RepID=A0ACC2UGE0_9FUNG|nr:hypothetical protein DSO57_1011195 [Entomophthora muscae]